MLRKLKSTFYKCSPKKLGRVLICFLQPIYPNEKLTDQIMLPFVASFSLTIATKKDSQLLINRFVKIILARFYNIIKLLKKIISGHHLLAPFTIFYTLLDFTVGTSIWLYTTALVRIVRINWLAYTSIQTCSFSAMHILRRKKKQFIQQRILCENDQAI